MKNFVQTIQNMLADAALLETGVATAMAPARRGRESSETLEENLIEVAFAEAAEYDQIHKAIQREHKKREQVFANACRDGVHDACFSH